MKQRRQNTTRTKPEKPYPDFPLFPHNNGQWAKKINGKRYYFGVWDDPTAALNRYLEQRDDLFAGRKPRPKDPEAATIRDLLNAFRRTQESRFKSNQITGATHHDYVRICDRLAKFFDLNRQIGDLDGQDFTLLHEKISRTRSGTSIANIVRLTRIVFKYAFDEELIDKPMRFGPVFRLPSPATLRREKNRRGPRMFQREEVLSLLDAAKLPVRAMILLGINCGFGNSDCAALTCDRLNLEDGWISFPRPKTGVQRICKLWPETIAEIRKWQSRRSQLAIPPEEKLLFITKRGQGWIGKPNSNPISAEFRKLTRKAFETQDLRQKPRLPAKGFGFYTLRHTFATIGAEVKDLMALKVVMGHIPGDILGEAYIENVERQRLENIANHVRQWLYGKPTKKPRPRTALSRTSAPKATRSQDRRSK
jgi:integrase